ncbi:sulfite exporter TauE/SafE family protein [Aneurinibacillus sp. Ricciae_BoGa-3]|uniref:sulfite exporter TauE/SafE family protein n=1 Tax=Aneurinibacillus sp. Ricciae_BoGa-3 TaxID=3022697 RepID=UPI0023413F8B|nr:sulfite exporter TauE/SafE family protein [Aneurinibacillus sp. Ricciae_BoGa-3]WCK56695.1 sulfite exporter TauE/SafE family protein [Aneurinibacillus sp. Ricciae_BoGa-3]
MSIGIAVMGLVVGFLVGMTGVGGAALLTPVLILLGINPTIAVGTDLFYNSITKLFGGIQHWRQKTVNVQMVKYLALGSIPGVVLAIGALELFGSFYHNQEQVIKHALGYVLVLVATAIVIRTFFDKKLRPNMWQVKPLEEKKGMTILIGAVFGFIVGLTSLGSGSLFAVAMVYLYRMKTSELVGTDIAHAFLLVSVAGILHAGLGSVNYMLVGNLLLGSIPGVLLGSTLSSKIPARPLRAVVAVLILISGLKLV